MITKEQVIEVLQSIQDPGLNRPLVEWNGIRDVMVREQSVSLTAVLSEDRDEWKQAVAKEIREKIKEIGVEEVHTRIRPMTDIEREQLTGKTVDPSQPKMGIPERPMVDPTAGVRFIAVASGKGGVGKSTVTVNLAVALARLGKKVGIIDADIYGFSVPDMMGIEERPQVKDNRVIPVERFGVKVISMGFFVEENAPVIWRGPMLGKMLRNFLQEVEWGDMEYILLDLPPGTGDVALDVHQMIPQSRELLVTTPHATAAFVAARAGAMALHTNHEIIGVIENMAYYSCSECGQKDYVFGRGGGAKLAQELNTKLLAQIPLGDPGNHPSEADFSPSVYKEETEIGQIYREVAEAVIQAYE